MTGRKPKYAAVVAALLAVSVSYLLSCAYTTGESTNPGTMAGPTRFQAPIAKASMTSVFSAAWSRTLYPAGEPDRPNHP